jgi:hypothetical protein
MGSMSIDWLDPISAFCQSEGAGKVDSFDLTTDITNNADLRFEGHAFNSTTLGLWGQ